MLHGRGAPARTRILVLTMGAIVSLGGCRCGGKGTLGQVVPKISVTPTSVAFGNVPLGAKKFVRLAVANQGGAPLLIHKLVADSPFTATAVTASIAGGATGSIEVVFTPSGGETTTGTVGFSGRLAIQSNDPATPEVDVMLSGVEVRAILSASPTHIDLSNTAVGTTRLIPILVSNSGLAEVDGNLRTDGFPRPEHYTLSTLTTFAGSAPLAIPPSSNVELDLQYHPIDIGPDSGRILLEVCGEECGIAVEVVASGAEADIVLEPAVVDFGTVGIGKTTSKPVVVKNVGANVVHIVAVSTTGGNDLTGTPVLGLPATLQPNSSMAINLDFTPSSAATFQGQLVVRTDSPAIPQASTAVSGKGQGPLFVVQPNPLAFGVQRSGATTKRAALLLNSGSADVVVKSIAFAGATASSSGAFSMLGVGLPVHLASGESQAVYVEFTPPALGVYTATISVGTDDPNHPTVQVPVSGGRADRLCQLDATGGLRVNFGQLPVGFSRMKSITLTNTGSDNCHIVSAAFRKPLDPAIVVIGSPFPATITPGQQVTLSFLYTPTMMIPSQDTYVMTTDDPVFPDRNLLLQGTAQEYADIFVQPNSLDFGSVMPMCTSGDRAITIFNAGNSAGFINSVTLTSTGTAFQLGSLPTQTIQGGASEPVGVAFNPQAVGAQASAVEVDVRNHTYPIIVPIKGIGSLNPLVTDQFTQSNNPKVDVLFIVGNVQAGADLQPGLLDNLGAFIAQTQVRNVDFQIGVTSTDVSFGAGQLNGPILTPQTPNIVGAFQQEAVVAMFSDDSEDGLASMDGAFQLAQLGVQPNASLFRPDAKLVVIIITDDDDASPKSVVSYFNELRAHAPRGYQVATVSGGATGCNGGDGINDGADPAPRLMNFVQLTQGLDLSECDSWATTLSRLGDASFGLSNRFFLTRAADQTKPMVVLLDGVQQMSGWTYDPASASISFSTPPGPGVKISVTYTPHC